MTDNQPNVALFVTCPVDLMRPEAGFASVKLLEQAGCRVTVPPQGCCGQIAYNNGLPEEAQELAWTVVERFESFDYVVTPSGSCGGMLRHHYPALFKQDKRLSAVEQFCNKVYEITTFLHSIIDWQPTLNADLSDKTITFHDSCAGLREMNIKDQPRSLLKQCANVSVTEMQDTNVCCGFGGSFCMKFPDIASRMADDKLENALATEADYLVGGDVSCLLHLAGRHQRTARGKPMEVRHVTELLAGELDNAPINALAVERGHGNDR